jgi:23S rRNA (guanosine2251-2'-O)-methyltransferase
MKKDYFLYGKHAVSAALSNPNRVKKELLVSKSAFESLDASLQKIAKTIKISFLEKGEFSKLLPQNSNHQQIALLTEKLSQPELQQILKNDCEKQTIVILDQISDPNNLGAVLRTSCALGVSAIIIPKDNAIAETPAVVKVASGAFEHTPLISVTNIREAMELLKKNGFWCIGLDAKGEKQFSEVSDFNKIALVIGGEEGMRKLVKSSCDILVNIPMPGKVESLNLSNAAAISIYHVMMLRS